MHPAHGVNETTVADGFVGQAVYADRAYEDNARRRRLRARGGAVAQRLRGRPARTSG